MLCKIEICLGKGYNMKMISWLDNCQVCSPRHWLHWRMENGECVLCYMTGAKKNSFSRNLTIIGKQLFIKPFCCSPLFEILFSFLWASVLLHLTNICCSPHHHHLNVLTVESHCHWSCHCCLNLINFASYWTVVNQTSGIQAVDWTSWLWHLGVDLLDAGFGFGNFWVDM